ncbi:hypothetical protein K437DRAFT_15736 [Tilletiaria anomala UBC 951]|uniref:Uncharacterized protein n=1 Tax=Tilletiaria anomala (strain ATCC 24038 / CBS 436.72 / UBC 951) TaxID=1037660 RepID=A0A066WED7_TILAU|nr:uncharacterized protein K437DRAFT_15736 [Tilletiaria anomala UBC 951]KDN52307.1 hypothetical protein K437DRAFT_15736 [Tilletiaria anomala UBC 951]
MSFSSRNREQIHMTLPSPPHFTAACVALESAALQVTCPYNFALMITQSISSAYRRGQSDHPSTDRASLSILVATTWATGYSSRGNRCQVTIDALLTAFRHLSHVLALCMCSIHCLL